MHINKAERGRKYTPRMRYGDFGLAILATVLSVGLGCGNEDERHEPTPVARSAAAALITSRIPGERSGVSRELMPEMVAKRSSTDVPVLVHLMPGQTTAPLLQLLAKRKLPVVGQGKAGEWTRVSILVPKNQASALAGELGALNGVFFVERIHRLGFFNDRSAGTIQSGQQGTAAGVTPIWQKGIRGQGQIVGMIDSGLDVDGCWFRDTTAGKLPKINTWSSAKGYGVEVDGSHRKVVAYDFLYSCDQFSTDGACESPTDMADWDNHGHGTHCAGSMVGDGPGASNNGIAPAAKIVVQDGGATTNACSDMPGLGCPVVDLYPIFAQAYAQGVRIHNNSYGDNEDAPPPNQSNYSARSQDVDRFAWDHKDMLFVFAAGNSGARNADFSVCSPSTNKNGLSVGSVRTSATSTSDNDISEFSSRGWSADGRIKPDLMTPGCTVSAGSDKNAASNNCAEDSGCGTSYAAPIAVGAAALARQYFTEGYYPSGAKNAPDALSPSAALLKAVLLNSAVAVTGRDNSRQEITPIPSNEQGWGRIQLDRSLLFKGATRKLYLDDHKTGFAAGDKSKVTYTFTGVSAAEPLKITLVWTDYPGTVDSPPASPKIDDLATLNAAQLVNDLDLTVVTSAATYLGNAFTNGASTKGGNADRRNNVEQVLLDKPVAGDVTVTVSAAKIAKAGQDFALVATGAWKRAGFPLAPDDAGAVDSGQNQAGRGGQAGSAAARPGDDGFAVAGSTGSSPNRTDGGGRAGGGIAGSFAVTEPLGAGSSAPMINDPYRGDISSEDGVAERSNGCSCAMVKTGSQSPSWLFILGIGVVFLRIRNRKKRSV